MGQQQLLLIILGVIIVGIAIAVGVAQFGAHSSQSNKDGVSTTLVNIAANAYQFKIRPTSMGGGGGAYDNSKGATAAYNIPSKMAADDNGTYTLTSTAPTTCVIKGTSTINTAWSASCTTNDTGKTTITYTGW
jgi:hypothetical protein